MSKPGENNASEIPNKILKTVINNYGIARIILNCVKRNTS